MIGLPRRGRWSLPVALSLSLSAAAACGGGTGAGGPAPADSSAPGDSPAAADSPAPADSRDAVDPLAGDSAATASRWTVGILESAGEPAGVATLTDVRSGRHDGFDRVVWTFDAALPRWKLEYVDRPVRACGSGDVVPLPGDAWLEVRFEPARAHDDEGRPTAAAPGATPALDRVREVARTCDFEAVLVHVLAVESPEAYRVLELEGPPRLVVDVRHRR